MSKYLVWKTKQNTDFSTEKISMNYASGFVFTRRGKGEMDQTRSLRIDLSKFELSSENRRILKKAENLQLETKDLPLSDYHWSLGKLAKDFYTAKFGDKVFSANKTKEILTTDHNFNKLFVYKINDEEIGYAICYESNEILHYSYPFYNLEHKTQDLIPNLGMSMMLCAIVYAKNNHKKYIYLGSFQRSTDVYKLQFKGLEWFDGGKWSNDLEELKNIL